MFSLKEIRFNGKSKKFYNTRPMNWVLYAVRNALLSMVFCILMAAPVSAGNFSEDICGATGWAMAATAVYDGDGNQVGTLQPKEAFKILSEENGRLEITNGEISGFVDPTNILINLPDVLPDIEYNLTNATGSVFTAASEAGASDLRLSIYGEQLYYDTASGTYAGKIWDRKLGKYEFPVPILYTAAEKIAGADALAEADGYALKIYDAYRTHEATEEMNSSFSELASKNSLYLGGYGTDCYVARTLSSHNVACAIDVTLTKDGKEMEMPTAMHVLSGDAVLLKPTASRVASSFLYGQDYSYYEANFSEKMTDGAKQLCQYMVNAGMTGLGSEWWHFQDEAGYRANKGYYGNLAGWYPTNLYGSGENTAIPSVTATYGDAVYQLWAAAGFPRQENLTGIEWADQYDWCYSAIQWAVSENIVSAFVDPEKELDGEGFLKLLYTYATGNTDTENASDWAEGKGLVLQDGGFSQKQMHGLLLAAAEAGIQLDARFI